jgi:hypothetical protein
MMEAVLIVVLVFASLFAFVGGFVGLVSLMDNSGKRVAARRRRRELKLRLKLVKSGYDPEYVRFLEQKLDDGR